MQNHTLDRVHMRAGETKSGEEPTASPPGEARRDRAPIELQVEYSRLNSFFSDYTKNISRGGTFIRTHRPLPVGTTFLFKLRVPDLPEPLALQGKVQWIVTEDTGSEEQPPGMGIAFVYDSEADRQRIEGTVERLMIRSLGPVLFEKLIGHRDQVDS